MAISDTTALVQSVVKYRAHREVLKEQNRVKLEADLEEWKADVGDEITAMRKSGLSVTDIGNIIGISNRTFIYEMIAASNRRHGAVGKPNPVPTQTKSASEWIEADEAVADENPYVIEWLDDSTTALVKFSPDEEYYITVDDGHPSPPWEWADHSRERRTQYKEILSKIRDRFKP